MIAPVLSGFVERRGAQRAAEARRPMVVRHVSRTANWPRWWGRRLADGTRAAVVQFAGADAAVVRPKDDGSANVAGMTVTLDGWAQYPAWGRVVAVGPIVARDDGP